jgi:hypothetical protein
MKTRLSPRTRLVLAVVAISSAVILAFMIGKRTGSRNAARASSRGPVSMAPGPDGKVDVCLQTKPPREFPPEGKLSMTIHGELVGLGPVRDLQRLPGIVVACDDLPHSYLDVVDSDYRMWRFLYSFSDLSVGRIKAQVGSRVTIKFRALLGFSKAAGFVVSDKTGIVLAVEDGAFGEGLSPIDEVPFSIRKADTFRLKQDHCGDAVSFALNVTADTEERVLPGRTGSVALAGAAYRFWNACSYDWVNDRCTDMLGDTSWVLWRE